MGLGNWFAKRVSDYFSQEVDPKRSYLSDFDRICHEVRLGDVLLIEGRNRVSRIIRRITHSPWSHAALYIGRIHDIEDQQLREIVHHYHHGNPSDQLVIESLLGKGTIITSLNYYREEHIRLCRPSGLTHEDAQKVIGYAIKRVGKEYHVRHFVDLGRFLIKSRLVPRHFNSILFRKDPDATTQEICSTMIASAFHSIQFPILPLIREGEGDEKNLEMINRNPKLFTPSDFDYSPFFNIIKYPIFPISDAPLYRNLPWREELMSNDEIGISERDSKNPKNQDNQTS